MSEASSLSCGCTCSNEIGYRLKRRSPAFAEI